MLMLHVKLIRDPSERLDFEGERRAIEPSGSSLFGRTRSEFIFVFLKNYHTGRIVMRLICRPSERAGGRADE